MVTIIMGGSMGRKVSIGDRIYQDNEFGYPDLVGIVEYVKPPSNKLDEHGFGYNHEQVYLVGSDDIYTVLEQMWVSELNGYNLGIDIL